MRFSRQNCCRLTSSRPMFLIYTIIMIGQVLLLFSHGVESFASPRLTPTYRPLFGLESTTARELERNHQRKGEAVSRIRRSFSKWGGTGFRGSIQPQQHQQQSPQQLDSIASSTMDVASRKGLRDVLPRWPRFESFALSARGKRVNWMIKLQMFVAMSLLVWQSMDSAGALLWSGWNNFQKIILWYSRLLDAKPLITKSITAGVIGVMGDYAAQKLEHGLLSTTKENENETPKTMTDTTVERESTPLQAIRNWLTMGGQYSGRRGLSIFADGLFLSGPLMHWGYELFEHVVPISGGGGTLAALAHVVADTLLLDSIFVAITFWVTGWFEGFSPQQIMKQFRRDYLSALQAGGITSLLVLPLELFAFRYLPLSFRVLAVNFIDIIWDAVISLRVHKSRGSEQSEREQAAQPLPLVPSLANSVA